MEKVKASDLGLGDVVRFSKDGYGDATVIKIEEKDGDKWITVFRPYVHISDFSYTGGVIPYIGTERFSVYGTAEVELLKRCRTEIR